MEYYSGRNNEEEQTEAPNTVERLSNWITGMQAEIKGQGASPENKQGLASSESQDDNRGEIEFDRRKEVQDVSSAIKKGSMIAVGEVLADKSTDQATPLIGAAGIRAAKQKKLTREEAGVSAKQAVASAQGLSFKQAVQLGILVGICIGIIALVWANTR